MSSCAHPLSSHHELSAGSFGNTFDKPIRQSLPYGTAIALKAIAYIDPALEQDICDG